MAHGDLPSRVEAAAAPKQESYYDLLKCSPKSTQSEIRAAYQRLSLEMHPDKARRSKLSHVLYAAINEAFKVLDDEVDRAMYDVEMGFVEDGESERQRIHQLKRRRAEKEITAMEETVKQVREREQSVNGLLLMEARYGDLQSRNRSSPLHIDVTVPLQCLVNDSALIAPGGRSKCWLPGFYDPVAGAGSGAAQQHKQLYIRYKFLGHVHQCVLEDMDAITIPLQEHLVSDEESDEFERQFRVNSRLEDAKKRRRRLAAAAVLCAVGATAYYLSVKHRERVVELAAPWLQRAKTAAQNVTDTTKRWAEQVVLSAQQYKQQLTQQTSSSSSSSSSSAAASK